MTTTLYQIYYSPWSEKARWALDFVNVDYKRKNYLPFWGALPLRVATGKPFKKITVPVIIAEESIVGSRAIAEHYAGDRLFHTNMEKIDQVDALANKLMEAGRVISCEKVLSNEAAMREAAPNFVPKSMRVKVVKFGINRIKEKYDYQPAGAEQTIEGCLQELESLRGGQTTFLDAFSYADIAVCCALQFVSPVAHKWIRLKPEFRTCWTMPTLASKFERLIAWRDETYERYR